MTGMGIIWSVVALAGLIAGGRATWVDLQARRWIWAILDIVWTLAAGTGVLLAYAVYDFTPSGL